jgi:hypothetical protein
MASQPSVSSERGSEESWAWSRLDPEIRVPLANQVIRELANRSIYGALVYFVVCVVLAFSTPYYHDHPIVLVSSTSCTLSLGILRIAAARRLRNQEPAGAPKRVFLFATYGTFVIWGIFCAWTLHLYATQWTAMILLLSTASLAGGASSSLAPSLHLGFR